MRCSKSFSETSNSVIGGQVLELQQGRAIEVLCRNSQVSECALVLLNVGGYKPRLPVKLRDSLRERAEGGRDRVELDLFQKPGHS